MSPTNPHIIVQLRQLIYYHLDNGLLNNALFLAGRLHAYEPRSSDAIYLLALCYLRLGQLKAAYDYSRTSGSRGTHLGCSYVFAQACLGLERCIEGISAIERSHTHWAGRNNWNKHSETRRQHTPDAAAVYCLKGKLWHAHGDPKKAVECYVESLKLNPFMWDAFAALCETGANVRIPNIFKITPEMQAVLTASNPDPQRPGAGEPHAAADIPLQTQPNNIVTSHALPANDPFSVSTNRLNVDGNLSANVYGLIEKLHCSNVNTMPTVPGVMPDSARMDTPITQSLGVNPNAALGPEGSDEPPSLMTAEPPQAPARKARTQGLGMDFSTDAPPKMRANSIRSKSRSKTDSDETDGPPLSRSSTLAPNALDRKRTVSGQASQATAPTAASNAHAVDPAAPQQRRSVRLFNQIRPNSGKFSVSAGTGALRDGKELKKAKATGTKGRSAANPSTVGRVVSGNRKPVDPMDVDGKDLRPVSGELNSLPAVNLKPAVNEAVKEREALQWLMDLFTKLGSGYFALTHYQCQDALQIFNSLPLAQRETPWVLAQMGRAHYEQSSYAEAEKYFVRIRSMAPARVEDMEVYSTILWHLKNQVELAFLAHELVELDRLSPQAWCAIGNSFSFQRDHDQALKCFKRAVQLDPKFAYAFTLQGHENIANEEYDKALVSYRSAIAADNRHYNAWYGLGKVYERMGKYEVAEQHYRTAANINPTNAVLVCCVGVVLEKMKNPKAALLQYTRACELAPKSPLSRFKKARVLLALQEPNLALVELQILKDVAPDDANVHFLLGRLYKVLHQKGDAIKHFTTALNLDPKAAQYIKEHMELLEDDDDDDDQHMS